MLPQLDDYKEEFEWDGSLRDIYVLRTSIKDWQLLLESLLEPVYPYAYFADGEEAIMPTSASELFEERSGRLLVVNAGPLTLNCHFFSE